MERGDEESCSEILRGDTRLGELRYRLQKLTKELVSFERSGEIVKEKLLVGGDCIRVGGGGGFGGVYVKLLRSGRESGSDDSGQVGGSKFLPWAVDGEIVAVKPFPNEGGERGHQKGVQRGVPRKRRGGCYHGKC